MARYFDSGNDEYLEYTAGAVVADVPFSMSAWVKRSALNDWNVVMSIADKDATHYHALICQQGEVEVLTYDGTTRDAETNVDTANEWNHVCGVWANATSRSVYIHGGNKTTNVTNATIVNIDNLKIGVSADSTPFGYFDGNIAEAAIWGVALTDEDVAILAKGYSPLFVKPSGLVGYWPLIRDR